MGIEKLVFNRFTVAAGAGALAVALVAGGHGEIHASAGQASLVDEYLYKDAHHCLGGFDTEVKNVKAVWEYRNAASHIPFLGKVANAVYPEMSETITETVRTEVCTTGPVSETYDKKKNVVTVNVKQSDFVFEVGIADPLKVLQIPGNNGTGAIFNNFANDVSALPWINVRVPGMAENNSRLSGIAMLIGMEQGSQSCAQDAYNADFADPDTHKTIKFHEAMKAKIKQDVLDGASAVDGHPTVFVNMPTDIGTTSTLHSQYVDLMNGAKKAHLSLPDPNKLAQLHCDATKDQTEPAGVV